MCNKIDFETKGQAKRYIKSMNFHYNKNKRVYNISNGTFKAKRAYKCPFCDKWHMTCQTKQQAKRYKC
jgi:hypothetical protein